MLGRARRGDRYTLRRKVLTVFGASFQVLDAEGRVIGFCRQKAFEFREDIRIYTDETKSSELLRLWTKQVIDIGARYEVHTPEGDLVCSLQQSGIKSSFVRDEWKVFDPEDSQIATITERGAVAPFVRRYGGSAAMIFPQRYHLNRGAKGDHIATFRQHFNPLIFKMGVAVHRDDSPLDELSLIGAVALIAAIEGRQS
ncbi:MAG: hypothetical protein CMJ31_00970 [Phycisphaerae bacterium]|nr:hypothetical protein [Phycisphaerae bacterium]|tara:strand:- start:363 stop:956 length:594 start_codon:yes stop_codon:yes gene_type:complete